MHLIAELVDKIVVTDADPGRYEETLLLTIGGFRSR